MVFSPLPEKLKKYDLPLYQRDNGDYVLHRIVKVREHYTCIGDNQFSYENGIRDDQIIAVVTGFYRKEKFISIENPLYKIYCAIWDKSRGLRNFWRRGIGFLRRHLK